jgi:hypothetical protein
MVMTWLRPVPDASAGAECSDWRCGINRQFRIAARSLILIIRLIKEEA